VVAKASGNLEIVHAAKLDEVFEASPAIADSDFFLRGHQHLYCFTAKQP